MTPKQQDTLLRWLPIALLFGSGLVAWTTLKRDVADSVRVPRFEQESINVRRDIRDLQRAIIEQGPRLDDICRAVRCASR